VVIPEPEEVVEEIEEIEAEPEEEEEEPEEEVEEEEEETTTGGGGSSVGGGAGGGSTTGGGDEIVPLEDSEFPIKEIVENGGSLSFVYGGREYTLFVEWEPGAVEILSSLGTLDDEMEVPKIEHEYGEEDDGRLRHGRVNLYDIDGDGEADLQMKPLYADQETGDISTRILEGLLEILIDTEGIENCLEEWDEDGDGLFGCADPECSLVYGFYGPDRGDPEAACTYGRELFCEDNFNNDGDTYTDELDIDCYGMPCSEGGILIWSYIPGDDQSYPPPINKLGQRRIACCENENQCVNINGECIDYDTFYETAAGNRYYICGDRNHWDRCGDSEEDRVNVDTGERSDGDSYLCMYNGGEYTWGAI